MRRQRFTVTGFSKYPSPDGTSLSAGFRALSILICLFPFWPATDLCAQTARLPKIQVERFSVEQGLADRNVTSILQDKQGYIWIGTAKGLSRFDGYNFLTYNTRPRNPHKINYSFLTRILLAPSGNLLLYYNRSGRQFDLLNPLTGQLAAVSFDENAASSSTSLPVQLSDGHIYILNVEEDRVKVYRLDEPTHKFVYVFQVHKMWKTPPGRINFLRAANGSFWFAMNEPNNNLSVIHSDPTGNILHTFVLPDRGPEVDGVAMDEFLTETALGAIWIATLHQGIYVLDAEIGQAVTCQPHPFLTAGNLGFSKDPMGNLLVYQENADHFHPPCYLFTTAGLLLDYNWMFNYQTVLCRPFSADYTLGLFSITNNGFNKYWLNPSSFTNFLAKELGNAPFGISARGMVKTGRDKLMISTDNHGIFELNLKTNQLTRPGDRSPQLMAMNNFHLSRTILAQGDSIFWISGMGGVLKYQPGQNKTTFYETSITEVWGASLGEDGKIWVADLENHLQQLDPASGMVTEYKNKDGSRPLENSQPTYLITGRDGTLWVGSGLAGLIRIDPVKRESRRFTANPGDPAGLNSNQIACLYEDAAGLLWVGTLEGGLQVFDPVQGRVIALYTRDNGLCDNNVVGILPDGNGNYWLSTFNGLSFFDTGKKTFRNYSTADGLSHNEFNRHSFFYDQEAGRFYFGGINGVNAFHKNELQPTENHAPLLVSDISYAAGNDRIIVQYEGVTDGSTYTLPPGNRLLHLHLALADYSNPAGNQFAYKIEGLDQDWNYLGTSHDLRLDHLPAGSFVLRLRGADNRGNWSSQEIALHLVVQTFWYKRWWAWLLYTLVLVAAGVYFYRFQLQRKIAEKEAHRLQELDTFKSRFFTNITHEFRTPLTVILGMTAQLKVDKRPWMEDGRQGKLQLIKRNGESLLRLINQILDLAKLESNTLKMDYVQGDVLPYLRYISESLHSLANAQNVLLRVESTEFKIVMDYDPERLLQIVHNLLSNAIKFTPSGGRVTLQADLTTFQKSTNLRLRVSDTGAGIPPEDLPNIFDRFYQADNLEKAKSGGTGIGLALTRELVEQMGGEISVISVIGTGSTFTARWPITRLAEHGPWHREFPLQTPGAPVKIPAGTAITGTYPNPVKYFSGSARPSLLLIEDNPDVVEYLAACLQDRYTLDFAYNGRAGIEKALETIPDLIISDVMMPEKTGFEVCDFLKNDERTSHIPLILLTAKADIESRITGLRRGADAYLAKPFHQEELLLTVANLLEARKKLQARFADTAQLPVAINATTPEVVEDAFVQKVRFIVEAHLSDAAFSVDQLCRALAMSQPQLHRKLTAVTGKNATLFIRAIRLEKAKAMLMLKEKTVSQVAYAVGFEDPKYFSRVFVEAFGVAPSKI